MEMKSRDPARSPFVDVGVEPDYRPRPLIPEVLRRPDIEVRQNILASVIEGEIVPRLLKFHQVLRTAPVEIDAPGIEEIAEFGALAIGPDAGAATAYFEKMQAKGHSLDTLFIQLLAPTARYLGELWHEDLCDFIDVTIGVARLQELLSHFGAALERPLLDIHHRALLIATDEEKHMFGVDMVAKFMRGAGWDVTIGAHLSAKESAALAARDWFGVVGLTLSAETGIDAVARTVEAVRRASRNKKVSVMVGGSLFTSNPDLVARVGADASACDAPTAVILAKKLLIANAG